MIRITERARWEWFLFGKGYLEAKRIFSAVLVTNFAALSIDGLHGLFDHDCTVCYPLYYALSTLVFGKLWNKSFFRCAIEKSLGSLVFQLPLRKL